MLYANGAALETAAIDPGSWWWPVVTQLFRHGQEPKKMTKTKTNTKKDKDKYKKIQRHGEELLKRNTMQGQARGLARGSHHLIIFRLPVEKQILSVFCRFLSKDLQIAHQTLKMHRNKQM